MATVGALVVDIQANTARLQKDMDKVRKQMNGLSKSARNAKKSLDGFQKGAIAIAKVTASVIALDRAWNLAFDAAKFQQAEQGFANLADSYGANAQSMIKDLREVSAGTLSTAQIMQNAGQAMLLGIPAEQLTKLMEIARASARVTGQSVEKSFQDIATGVGRQSKLILDNLGILVSAGTANEEYAKSLGKTVGQLTDAEKKQAFFNATVIAGDKIIQQVGVRAKTTAEAMETFKASVEDLKIILGKLFISISSGLSSALLAASSGFQTLLAVIAKSFGKLLDQMAKIPIIGEQFRGIAQDVNIMAEALNESAIATAGQSIAAFDVATNIWKQAEALEAVNQKKQEGAVIDEDLEKQKKARAELGGLETPDFGDAPSNELVKMAVINEEKLVLIEDFFAKKFELLQAANATEDEIEETRIQGVKAREERIASLKVASSRKIMDAQIGLGLALARAAGVSGKKMFLIEKAIAIGRAVVATNLGAAQALALGPAGIPIAATIKSMGLLNIATIAASAIGGGASGGGGGGSAGGGAFVSSDLNRSTTPTSLDEEVRRGNQAVTINIENGTGSKEYWQEIVDEIIVPGINDSSERNINLTVQTT